MKGIYLATYKAYHPNYTMDYNDIEKTSYHVNIIGDMLSIDLVNYDYIIATPPCNYWRRANYRREISEYSQLTKHLLPNIIDKCIESGKPFIIENVKNEKMFIRHGLYNKQCYIYKIGRHTYWTNILMNDKINQQDDDIQSLSGSNRQGGKNVHEVIEYWLESIHPMPQISLFDYYQKKKKGL